MEIMDLRPRRCRSAHGSVGAGSFSNSRVIGASIYINIRLRVTHLRSYFSECSLDLATHFSSPIPPRESRENAATGAILGAVLDTGLYNPDAAPDIDATEDAGVA